MVLAANGYMWRGRAHVDLTLSVELRAGRPYGQLRVRDSAARLALTSLRIDRLRPTRHGMLVSGVAHVGRRTVPFTLDVETAGHATTFTLTVTPLRYHFSGVFHGRLLPRAPRATASHTRRPGRGAPIKRVTRRPSRRPGSRGRTAHR